MKLNNPNLFVKYLDTPIDYDDYIGEIIALKTDEVARIADVAMNVDPLFAFAIESGMEPIKEPGSQT